MLTCYHCGRIIKGKAIITSPPIYLVRLGLDRSKAFHPACYVKAQAKNNKLPEVTT